MWTHREGNNIMNVGHWWTFHKLLQCSQGLWPLISEVLSWQESKTHFLYHRCGSFHGLWIAFLQRRPEETFREGQWQNPLRWWIPNFWIVELLFHKDPCQVPAEKCLHSTTYTKSIRRCKNYLQSTVIKSHHILFSLIIQHIIFEWLLYCTRCWGYNRKQ